jgi:hypothetical protein
MEAMILELNSDSNWDGTSLTTLNRDDAVITNQRYYKFTVTGPHGVLAPDLGGLFSPTSVKLIGIAYNFWNPTAKARVITSDPTGAFRQEVTLRPEVQFVTLFPGDKLSIVTKDTRVQVVLVVNEMNEHESLAWGLRHEPSEIPTRFRIIRETGTAFVPNPVAGWQPAFTFDSSTGLMVVADDGTGAIPSTSLSLYPRHQGAYVSLRYSGSNADGKVHIVDNTTRKTWIAQTALTDGMWSKVQYISHDDNIALEATPAVAGQIMTCDIEVAPVQADSRLRARYLGGA